MDQIDAKYLSPTPIIDCDHPEVVDFAKHAVNGADDPIQKAVRLYYAVRDGIWYDPYYPFFLPEHYQASNVLKSGRGYCVSKAALLCAVGRASGIPTRVGFATVKNHLATKQLIEYFSSDVFVFHGFTELYLDGCWIKATPAFNVELCRRHQVAPLDFNGREDSIFHSYNTEKKLFMEYMDYHGEYADIPVDLILSAWEGAYGKRHVKKMILSFKGPGQSSSRDFFTEQVWNG